MLMNLDILRTGDYCDLGEYYKVDEFLLCLFVEHVHLETSSDYKNKIADL